MKRFNHVLMQIKFKCFHFMIVHVLYDIRLFKYNSRCVACSAHTYGPPAALDTNVPRETGWYAEKHYVTISSVGQYM